MRIAFKRLDGPLGRSPAPMRKNGPVWIASRLIRRQSGPPFDPLRVHAKPLAPFIQTRRNEKGHSNPIARHPAPRLRSTTFYPTCGKKSLVCKQQPSYTCRTRDKTLFVGIRRMMMRYILAVLLTAASVSVAGPASSNATPEAVVERMMAATLSGDYHAFTNCIAPDGFRKLGIKKDEKQFQIQSRMLQPIWRGYETRTNSVAEQKAVVTLISYGVVDGEGLQEERSFELHKLDGMWMIYTDIDMKRTPYPIEKMKSKRERSQQDESTVPAKAARSASSTVR